MRVALFSARKYEVASFTAENAEFGHEIECFEHRLNAETAALAHGRECVCAFVNDDLGAATLDELARGGTRLIALRSAGFNHVDLAAAARHGLRVVRVPAYSPHAVAEHAVALILTLNRKVHRAYNRTREGNFALDGLMGWDVYRKTVGVVGTGKIGQVFAGIMKGFGCSVLAHDPYPNEKAGLEYVGLDELLERSDVISLHCPLMKDTKHLVNDYSIGRMKRGVMIVNTSRGALIDTAAAIRGMKAGRIGSLALDVYEEEADWFFADHSEEIIEDDVLMRLMTFPNVLITAHQAFFTQEALAEIARVTLENVAEFEKTGKCANEVRSR